MRWQCSRDALRGELCDNKPPSPGAIWAFTVPSAASWLSKIDMPVSSSGALDVFDEAWEGTEVAGTSH